MKILLFSRYRCFSLLWMVFGMLFLPFQAICQEGEEFSVPGITPDNTDPVTTDNTMNDTSMDSSINTTPAYSSQSAKVQFLAVPRNFGNIPLGNETDRESVDRILKNSHLYEVDTTTAFGDFDHKNIHIIRARSLPQIPYVYFQFFNPDVTPENYFEHQAALHGTNSSSQKDYKLYMVIVAFDPAHINYFQVLNSLIGKYGQPNTQRPNFAEWENSQIQDGQAEQPVRIIIEQSITEESDYVIVKYLHVPFMLKALKSNKIYESLKQEFQQYTKETELLNGL